MVCGQGVARRYSQSRHDDNISLSARPAGDCAMPFLLGHIKICRSRAEQHEDNAGGASGARMQENKAIKLCRVRCGKQGASYVDVFCPGHAKAKTLNGDRMCSMILDGGKTCGRDCMGSLAVAAPMGAIAGQVSARHLTTGTTHTSGQNEARSYPFWRKRNQQISSSEEPLSRLEKTTECCCRRSRETAQKQHEYVKANHRGACEQ